MKKTLYTVIVLVLVHTTCLWANPFTGSGTLPAQINNRPPSEFVSTTQAHLHTQLGEYIYAWTKKNSLQTFGIIMMIAFLYGFVHALGPGHRKTIVFSYYISKAAPIWEPLVTSLLLASLHGITTIGLLVIFRNVKGSFSGNTTASAIYLESISYGILAVLALASILHILSHTFPHLFPHFHFGCGCTAHGEPPHYEPCRRCGHPAHTAAESSHTNAAHCCSHHEERAGGTHGKMQWGFFILSGLYPCPAALLVLLLVVHLDAVGLGIAAIMSMSLGMTVPITAVAYLAWAGRVHLFYRIRGTQRYVRIITLVLGLGAYGTIFMFSVMSLTPVIRSFL